MSNEGYDAASRAAMKPGIAYVGAGELVWEAMLKAARPSPLP
jgi:hypothetical protein